MEVQPGTWTVKRLRSTRAATTTNLIPSLISDGIDLQFLRHLPGSLQFGGSNEINQINKQSNPGITSSFAPQTRHEDGPRVIQSDYQGSGGQAGESPRDEWQIVTRSRSPVNDAITTSKKSRYSASAANEHEKELNIPSRPLSFSFAPFLTNF